MCLNPDRTRQARRLRRWPEGPLLTSSQGRNTLRRAKQWITLDRFEDKRLGPGRARLRNQGDSPSGRLWEFLGLSPLLRQRRSQIERAAHADRLEIALQPLLGRFSPEVAQ